MTCFAEMGEGEMEDVVGGTRENIRAVRLDGNSIKNYDQFWGIDHWIVKAN